MLKLYKKYLEVVDEYLKTCFNAQRPFIHCIVGCSDCCEVGEYPFSRLEMEYLMAGFPTLSADLQLKIKNDIKDLLKERQNFNGRFLHKCPFLVDKKCVLYERRGITCRAYGLASFEYINGERIIKLPECSKCGLNYSEVLCNGTVSLSDFAHHGVNSPIKHSLKLDFFEKELLKGFSGLEFGEIRPLLSWFEK